MAEETVVYSILGGRAAVEKGTSVVLGSGVIDRYHRGQGGAQNRGIN